MGCGNSKPEYHDQNAPRPVQGALSPTTFAPPQQPVDKTKKQKAVKAGSNLGLLSMLAG